MSFDYEIAAVKEPAEGEGISFGVIVKNDPRFENSVFIFEDLTFVEDGEGAFNVGFVFIEPGGARKRLDELSPEMVDIMTELATQIANDVLTKAMDEASHE